MLKKNKQNISIRKATCKDLGFIIPLIEESSGGVWPVIWNELCGNSNISNEYAVQYMSDSSNKLNIENTVIGELQGLSLAAMVIYNESPEPKEKESSKVKYSKHLTKALTPYNEMKDLKSLFISELCTSPASRGMGVGTIMLSYAKKMALKYKYSSLTLRVFSDNKGAVRLYESQGFTIVDRRKVLPFQGITAKEDILLMRYRINPREVS